jgi:hypothetical protein
MAQRYFHAYKLHIYMVTQTFFYLYTQSTHFGVDVKKKQRVTSFR